MNLRKTKKDFYLPSAIFLLVILFVCIVVLSESDSSDSVLQSEEFARSPLQQDNMGLTRAGSKEEENAGSKMPRNNPLAKSPKGSQEVPPYPSRAQLLSHKPFIIASSSDGHSALSRSKSELECDPKERPLKISANYHRTVDPETMARLESNPLVAVAKVEGPGGFRREFQAFSDETTFVDTDRAYKYHGIYEQIRRLLFHFDRYDDDPPFPWTASVSVGETSIDFVIVAKQVRPISHRFTVYERSSSKPSLQRLRMRGNVLHEGSCNGIADYELIVRQSENVDEVRDAKIVPKVDGLAIDHEKYLALGGNAKPANNGYWVFFSVPSSWRHKEVLCELTIIDLTGKRFEYESKIKWAKRD